MKPVPHDYHKGKAGRPRRYTTPLYELFCRYPGGIYGLAEVCGVHPTRIYRIADGSVRSIDAVLMLNLAHHLTEHLGLGSDHATMQAILAAQSATLTVLAELRRSAPPAPEPT
ncbi:MAG: hypothetical protein VW405_10485 [Rhodospirillaceae bacterium]